jgi:hypothetical protein
MSFRTLKAYAGFICFSATIGAGVGGKNEATKTLRNEWGLKAVIEAPYKFVYGAIFGAMAGGLMAACFPVTATAIYYKREQLLWPYTHRTRTVQK